MSRPPNPRPKVRYEILEGGPVVYVPLTQGKWSIIDLHDASEILKYTWSFSGNGYAVRQYSPKKWIYLHQQILGYKNPDHVNRNKLDNRRHNLRTATPSQNRFNASLRSNNTSGYRGVYLHSSGKYVAQIKENGTYHYLGCFSSIDDAVIAYREAQRKYHGEFAPHD